MFSKMIPDQGVGLGLLMLPLAGSYVMRMLNNSDDLNIVSLAMIFLRFRVPSFEDFMRNHRASLKKGKETGEYTKGVCNYYSEMHNLITMCNGPFWHFVPLFPGKTLRENHIWYHEVLAKKYLQAKPTDQILEIGCGYGELGRQVAKLTGAQVTGLTMADSEIAGGNARIKAAGLEDRCRIVQGNYHSMTQFSQGTFDKVFGVYCVKYSAHLDLVFGEVSRLLKPGGVFLSYEILVSDKYDGSNANHRAYVQAISDATCMPPLHHHEAMRVAAKKAGLVPFLEEDLSDTPGADPWWTCFTRSGVHQVMCLPGIMSIIRIMEAIRLFPPSFADWFEHMIYHPSTDFVNAGRLGIIHSSTVMMWQKPSAGK